jgi:hypothetical protein
VHVRGRERATHDQARADAQVGEEAQVCADAQVRADTQARAQGEANVQAQAGAQVQAAAAAAAEETNDRDVIPWLRALGYNAEAARRGAASCAHIPEASLEERVKAACQSLARHCIRRPAPVASSAP